MSAAYRTDISMCPDSVFKSADAEWIDRWECFPAGVPANQMAGCFAEKQGRSIVAAANSEGELIRYLDYIRPDKLRKPEHGFENQSANNRRKMKQCLSGSGGERFPVFAPHGYGNNVSARERNLHDYRFDGIRHAEHGLYHAAIIPKMPAL